MFNKYQHGKEFHEINDKYFKSRLELQMKITWNLKIYYITISNYISVNTVTTFHFVIHIENNTFMKLNTIIF